MRINGNELRPGNVVLHNQRLWTVVKVQHVKPGKGGAFAQVELKEVVDGTKLNERFRSSESVERVRLDQREFQFLFADGDHLNFMDLENYEQITVSQNLVAAEQRPFLVDGLKVTIESYEGNPISVALPEQVTAEIAETDAVVKGQTAASSYKPAKLTNGVNVQVPPFITAGERIVVNLEGLTYLRRSDN